MFMNALRPRKRSRDMQNATEDEEQLDEAHEDRDDHRVGEHPGKFMTLRSVNSWT